MHETQEVVKQVFQDPPSKAGRPFFSLLTGFGI
jgi:hypothetical protein